MCCTSLPNAYSLWFDKTHLTKIECKTLLKLHAQKQHTPPPPIYYSIQIYGIIHINDKKIQDTPVPVELQVLFTASAHEFQKSMLLVVGYLLV